MACQAIWGYFMPRYTGTFTHNWKKNRCFHAFHKGIKMTVKYKQLCPGFELGTSISFLMLITVTQRACLWISCAAYSYRWCLLNLCWPFLHERPKLVVGIDCLAVFMFPIDRYVHRKILIAFLICEPLRLLKSIHSFQLLTINFK